MFELPLHVRRRYYFDADPRLAHETNAILEQITIMQRQAVVDESDSKAEKSGQAGVFQSHPRKESIIYKPVVDTLYYCCYYHWDEAEVSGEVGCFDVESMVAVSSCNQATKSKQPNFHCQCLAMQNCRLAVILLHSCFCFFIFIDLALAVVKSIFLQDRLKKKKKKRNDFILRRSC